MSSECRWLGLWPQQGKLVWCPGQRRESPFRGWGRILSVHSGNDFFTVKGRDSKDMWRDSICSWEQFEIEAEAPGKEIQGDPQWRVLVPTCSELASLEGRVPARQDPGGKAVSTAWTLEGSCPSHLAPSRGKNLTFSVLILLCGLFLYFRRLWPGSGAVPAASLDYSYFLC